MGKTKGKKTTKKKVRVSPYKKKYENVKYEKERLEKTVERLLHSSGQNLEETIREIVNDELPSGLDYLEDSVNDLEGEKEALESRIKNLEEKRSD